MNRSRVVVLFESVLCLSLLAGCATAGPERVVDRGSASLASAWTVLVRDGTPRWLGPAWWRGQGYDPAAMNRDEISVREGDAAIPALWQESPEGWGLLLPPPRRETPLAPGGSYVVTVGDRGESIALSQEEAAADGTCRTTTVDEVTVGPDTVFRSTAPAGSTWLWTSLRPVAGVTVTLPLTDVVPGTPVQVDFTVWGQSSMPQEPDHRLQILWDGEVVDDHLWDGDRLETWAVTVPNASSDGHTLGLLAPGGTEAPVELTWLDEVAVAWQRYLSVEPDGWVRWRPESADRVCLAGADGTDVEDLVAVFTQGDGRVAFAAPREQAGWVSIGGTAGSEGWVGVPWSAPEPDMVRERRIVPATALSSVTYLAVADEDFHEALGPLIEARRAQGHVAEIITPESLYDTFGHGYPDAGAIQVMVRDLADQGNLAYLLLVGDASPHPGSLWDRETRGIPTAWARTSHVGATPSDYALATGGTESPLVAVGRLPVERVVELEAVVAKTLSWEPSERLLLVRDDEKAFGGLTDQLGEIRTPDGVVDAGERDARASVLQWLAEGSGVLVYTGHGSMSLLGDEKLLILEDGAALRQPSVVAAWTCLCASFAHPDYASLAEAWLLAPQGVVAMVGPTGETTTGEQTALALAFQRAIVGGDAVGQAMFAAWSDARSDDSRHGFVLLGDPALTVMPGPGDAADG